MWHVAGKSVHNLAKSVEDPEIRTKAKNLELAWRPRQLDETNRFLLAAFSASLSSRQDFKKRKASTDDLPGSAWICWDIAGLA